MCAKVPSLMQKQTPKFPPKHILDCALGRQNIYLSVLFGAKRGDSANLGAKNLLGAKIRTNVGSKKPKQVIFVLLVAKIQTYVLTWELKPAKVPSWLAKHTKQPFQLVSTTIEITLVGLSGLFQAYLTCHLDMSVVPSKHRT